VRTSGRWDAPYVFRGIPAFAVANILVQIYHIAGGGDLFGHIGTHILDDMAAHCGGAPADWTAYLASIKDKVRPRGVPF
jgi:hypothetical protein